ncbi:MAG: glycerol kinase [Alphaproteobacteria bacterium]|nr:MAG: glycerol kinase [Alphaproteobacteria bacterium]
MTSPDSATLLSIDAGTTSTRALVFDLAGGIRGQGQKELTQFFPAPGWVEHDASEIWARTADVVRTALEMAGQMPAAIGITNQRETCLLWDADSGMPLAPAIVWQDRRTTDLCRRLRQEGLESEVRARTGLLLDPYFSATKLAWLLDNTDGARALAARGRLRAGTIDSWLVWRLTGGRVHATDATNASRTMLFNIHDGGWDPWLLDLFGVPADILPEVRDCAGHFGVTDPTLFGAEIPITGIAGDQQAATVGQACFAPGMIKATYGTGAFLLLNTGGNAVTSDGGLLATIAYQVDGQPVYAIEGSIFSAGSAVQWLRDALGLIRSAAETEAYAAGLPHNKGVYLVPAFTGLGAPHWDPEARGLITGIGRDTGPPELARAALESVAYQTRDLLEAMFAALGEAAPSTRERVLRADGGMTANRWLMQFLTDMVDMPVDVAVVTETTALGAAYLAGLGAGLLPDLDAIAARWQVAQRYRPRMDGAERDALYAGWQQALNRTLWSA